MESVLLSALGGILGCLLVLPLNGVTTGIGNANFARRLSIFTSRRKSCWAALLFAVVLGSIGGVFPARNASRKEILTALREV